MFDEITGEKKVCIKKERFILVYSPAISSSLL